MNCRLIDQSVENMKRGEVGRATWDDLRFHCDQCQRCRDKYSGFLEAIFANDAHRPQSKIKRQAAPVRWARADEFSDISEAAEFKDAPIAFTRHFNGKAEEIKVVEPEVDVPLPKKSRLVVHEGEDCLCDVVFDFNSPSNRPYELRFRVMMGAAYPSGHLVTFGTAAELDKDLRSVYRLTVVDRGGVRADIEMTGGRARLKIVYKPLQT